MSYSVCTFCAQVINAPSVLRTNGQWFHRDCYDSAVVEQAGGAPPAVENTVENVGTDDPQARPAGLLELMTPWEVWTVKVRRKLMGAGERDAGRRVWSEDALRRMAERNADLVFDGGVLWMSVEVSPEQAAALVRPKADDGGDDDAEVA